MTLRDREQHMTPRTPVEMHMVTHDTGEGRALAQSATTTNGWLELENYGNKPIKLLDVTLEETTK